MSISEENVQDDQPMQKSNASLETSSMASSSEFPSIDYFEHPPRDSLYKTYYGLMTSWTDLGPEKSYGRIKCSTSSFQDKKDVVLYVHISQLKVRFTWTGHMPYI